jgi:hypothetical protein
LAAHPASNFRGLGTKKAAPLLQIHSGSFSLAVCRFEKSDIGRAQVHLTLQFGGPGDSLEHDGHS